MVRIALKKGISGMAITDHNTIKGGLKAMKYESDEFQVVVGSEINTDRGEVLGLFLSEEIGPVTLWRSLERSGTKTVVVIPHPFELYPEYDPASR